MKRQPTEWRIFTNYTSDKILISRLYKEIQKLNIKTNNHLISKWTSKLNSQFPKRINGQYISEEKVQEFYPSWKLFEVRAHASQNGRKETNDNEY